MGRLCYLCSKKYDKEKEVSLHKFPSMKNEKTYKKWLQACELTVKDNVSNLYVCSLHFETKYKIGGGKRLKIRNLAFPSINVSGNVNECEEDNTEKSFENAAEECIVEESVKKEVATTPTPYSLKSLHDDIQLFIRSNKLPDGWGFVKVPLGIGAVYVSDDAIPSKSIFIKEDMTIKISAKSKPSSVAGMKHKVDCFNDLLESLKTVDELCVCQGGNNGQCFGNGFFGLFTSEFPRRTTLCQTCRHERKKKQDRDRHRVIRSETSRVIMNRKMNFVRNLKRKYERLLVKMQRAQEEIQLLKKKCATQDLATSNTTNM